MTKTGYLWSNFHASRSAPFRWQIIEMSCFDRCKGRRLEVPLWHPSPLSLKVTKET